jgi:hypothetical protein
MKIILIEPDSDFRDLIDLKISEILETDDIDTVPFDNTMQAWSMISILDDVSVIVCKDNFEDTHSVKFICDKVSESKLDISVVSIGSDIGENTNVSKVLPENASAVDIANAVHNIVKFLKDHDQVMKTEEELRNKRYKSVPINLFKYFTKVPFDFYIRLLKGEQYQFIKRINKNEDYDLKMINSYIEKNLTRFYIDKETYPEFTSLINVKLKQLVDTNKVSGKSKEEIQKYVLVQLSSTGFNESNLEFASESIQVLSKKIDSVGSKSKLLSEVYNSQLGFRFQRNYMVSIIGHLIVKSSDWAESKHSEYINMASYIHDMFLESEEEMDIASQFELDQFTTDRTKKERINKHALLAADKVMAMDQIPADVANIVRQHHGMNSGVGYSTDFAEQIKKLSIVFIVAEEVSCSILKSPREKINLRGIFKEINLKYKDNAIVAKCLDALTVAFESKS